jgi:hypothetical protein
LKKVLIISPQFAPVNSADSHRVRQMLPYLKDNNWNAEIVAVRLDRLEKPVIDKRLLDTIPNDIKVHFVGAFNFSWTRRIGLGSLSIRSFFHYYIFLNRLLKKHDFDLIFFSTTSFHLLALGRIIKRKFKVPYVLDIQDPWRSDFYLDKPKSERPPKFFLNYHIDKFLEAFSVSKADGIISVSKDYLNTFELRYTSVTANQMVIPFSATSFDFNSKIIPHPKKKQEGLLNIVYVGRGGHDLGFAINCFFEAVKKIESDSVLTSKQLAISFIGTSYAPNGEGIQTIKPIADKIGLNSLVIEQTDRVGYFEAIDIIQNADLLFIPGSTDSSYTASKIYPYILANKPMIACFHENSSVVEILGKCSNTNVVKFNSESATENIINELYLELEYIIQNINQINWRHNEMAMKQYMAPEMTRKIVEIFEATQII